MHFQYKPLLILLSEPQIFQCDILPLFTSFQGNFSFHLNSEDLLCPDLPLMSKKAKGGTMAMWRVELDPFIKVLPSSSPAILPLVLAIPGLTTTAHVTVYLPTSGRDPEFFSALATLDSCVQQIQEDFSCPIYLRGDFNVNPNNTNRVNILKHFNEKHNFCNLNFGHPTHHHFTGNGESDAQLDLLLYRGPPERAESLTSIACCLLNPLVSSHHDLILSNFSVSLEPLEPSTGNITAPRIPNNRVKIKGEDGNIPAFESVVSSSLARLRSRWAGCTGPESFSILLEATNNTLNLAAQTTDNSSKIPFSREAEHVGILRCTSPGNMASILARLSAHNRALHAVLPAGLARRHHGNPAAALRVEQLYGLPILLSGLAALVLSKSEQDTLDHHHKVKLEGLHRLYPRTPAPVVFFLAGSLPASAKYHLRQLSLRGMVARLGPDSILHRYGRHILASPPSSCPPSSSPWFVQIRQVSQKYGLPDPLYVLANPPTKGEWKSKTKLLVLDYCAEQLRAEAAALDSLEHFRASHMSLRHPSPIWTSCGNNQYEVKKATVQARMFSGRYRTCWMRRHFGVGETGVCRVPGCSGSTPGTLMHLATGQCPGLTTAVRAATLHWSNFILKNPILNPLVQVLSQEEPAKFLEFLLDPSTQPSVISLVQEHGKVVMDQLCHLSRTWLYLLHRERFKKLGLWLG